MRKAMELFDVEWAMEPTRFWRLKTLVATTIAAAFAAWDYQPGRVPRTVVRVRERTSGAVVYESVWKWDAQAAKREAETIRQDLERTDIAAFCDRYGIKSVAPH